MENNKRRLDIWYTRRILVYLSTSKLFPLLWEFHWKWCCQPIRMNKWVQQGFRIQGQYTKTVIVLLYTSGNQVKQFHLQSIISGLAHNTEQSFMCYTIGPCWFSILNTAVCTRLSRTFCLSLPSGNPKLSVCESLFCKFTCIISS